MRILGVDLGSKRIGIAVAESDVQVASPRGAIAASGSLKSDATAIASLARTEEAELVVIGLALDPEGNEGKVARASRMLGHHLEALGLGVSFVDETLTSVRAEERLLETDLRASQRKKRRDGEAACLILERYLDETKEAH